MKKAKNMGVLERVTAPTPKFFRIVRTIGFTLAAAGGAILAAPVALPAVVVSGLFDIGGCSSYCSKPGSGG